MEIKNHLQYMPMKYFIYLVAETFIVLTKLMELRKILYNTSKPIIQMKSCWLPMMKTGIMYRVMFPTI